VTDIVERLRAGRLNPPWGKTMEEAATEIERLRQIYFDRVKEQADEIERLRANQERMWCKSCGTVTRDGGCDCTSTETPETQNLVNYADSRQGDIVALLAEIELLRALLKRHDDCWHTLHEREYTGALRDDTRAAFGDAPKYDANFHPEGWDEVDGND
jgi:hypothetical protein